jgi:hypothetical protein
MRLNQPKPAASGWKRLWIILSTLWVVQAGIIAALVTYRFLSTNPDRLTAGQMAIGLLEIILISAVYLAAPPWLAKWGAILLGRMASGGKAFAFRSLTPARKAWIVLAGAFYVWFFLPGVAYLVITVASMGGSVVGALPPAASRLLVDSMLNTMINLPAWAALTFGSYPLMRLADWVWKGFARAGQG